MLLSIPWICCISTSKMCGQSIQQQENIKTTRSDVQSPFYVFTHKKTQNGQAIWENQGHAETLNKISRAVQSETFYEVFTKAVLKMNKTASLGREPFLIHHSMQLDLFPIEPFLKGNVLHEHRGWNSPTTPSLFWPALVEYNQLSYWWLP